MKQKNEKKLAVVEWVFYPLAGVLALGGIALMILGLITDYATSSSSSLAVYQAEAPLSFIGWGIITLALGVLLGVIVLLVFAQKSDREIEKASRRAARLGKSLVNNDAIVDAEVTKIEKEDENIPLS